MQFDGGYLSPYFITNAEKMICELENPYIIFMKEAHKSTANVADLEATANLDVLLIIAEDVEGRH